MKTDLTGLRQELQRKIEAVDLLLGGSRSGDGLTALQTYAKRGPKPGRRKMSAAGRAKIAAAARLRWKKARAAGRNSL